MQMMFSSFTSLFAPLTLTRIGTGAAGNAVFFTIVGIIIAITQGGLIGPLSRRFGERRLIFAGQLLLAVGMLVLAFVPLQPTPSYSRAAVLDELNNSGVAAPASESGVNLELEIEPPPDDTPRGYLGVAWVIAALAPLAIGNAFLQPNINSLITKLVTPREIGRVLGVSASFFSAANTLGPLAGGAVYETAGATALFVFDAVFILVILFIALRRIQPAPDETPQAVPAAHP
jgi:MFS family permease